jgi:DNA-binding NtrC family response regulator
MKYALLNDEDAVSRSYSATLLKSLGYTVAETDNTAAALNAARALRFDVILTTAVHGDGDRRGMPGELSRVAPWAATILLVPQEGPLPAQYRHFSGTVTQPVTVRALRHALEFGLDGTGPHPVSAPVARERRGGRARRSSARSALQPAAGAGN